MVRVPRKARIALRFVLILRLIIALSITVSSIYARTFGTIATVRGYRPPISEFFSQLVFVVIYIGLAIPIWRANRWVIWPTVILNCVIVAMGLMTLPNFGHLHGGEGLAFLAVPALLELAAEVFALVSIANSAKTEPPSSSEPAMQ